MTPEQELPGKGFRMRGLEFHSSRMWQWAQVRAALDFMQKFGMNTLIFHQNDIVDHLVFPHALFSEELMWKRWPVRLHSIYQNRHYINKVAREAKARGIAFCVEIKEIWYVDQVLEQVPTQIANYLLNEKRRAITEIEQRHDAPIVIVADPAIETPHYNVVRLRENEMGEESSRPSYHRTSPRKLELHALTKNQLNIPPAPAVTKVQPVQPMPSRAVQAFEGEIETPATPVATTAAAVAAPKRGFWSRLMSVFTGDEGAAQTGPTTPAAPAKPQGERPRREDRGPRPERGNRSERSPRGERPERSNDRSERPGVVTGEQPAQRAERGERPGRGERKDRGAKPERSPEEQKRVEEQRKLEEQRRLEKQQRREEQQKREAEKAEQRKQDQANRQQEGRDKPASGEPAPGEAAIAPTPPVASALAVTAGDDDQIAMHGEVGTDGTDSAVGDAGDAGDAANANGGKRRRGRRGGRRRRRGQDEGSSAGVALEQDDASDEEERDNEARPANGAMPTFGTSATLLTVAESDFDDLPVPIKPPAAVVAPIAAEPPVVLESPAADTGIAAPAPVMAAQAVAPAAAPLQHDLLADLGAPPTPKAEDAAPIAVAAEATPPDQPMLETAAPEAPALDEPGKPDGTLQRPV